MGPRTGTPDSLPRIGPLPGLAHVIMAAGHAPRPDRRTAHWRALVAALAAGEARGIDLASFVPQRVRKWRCSQRPTSGPAASDATCGTRRSACVSQRTDGSFGYP